MLERLRQVLQRRLETLTGQPPHEEDSAVDPSQVERLRTQGNALIANGQLNEAETCFSQALEMDSDDTRLLVCLGYVLKEQRQFAQARIVLKRAARPANSDPAAFEAYYLLGQISEEQSDLEDAKTWYMATLRLKPDFARACESVLDIFRTQGRENETTAILEGLVRLCPKEPDYRVWLASRCQEEDDFQGVADHLIEAVALGIEDVRLFVTIGAALCRLDREQDSLPYFRMAEKADPSLAYQTQYHRGYYHSRNGNPEAAVEFLERSVNYQPDFMTAHTMLLLNLSYFANAVDRHYKDAAVRFGKAVKTVAQPFPEKGWHSTNEAGKFLRVGFVAGEFRKHPIFYFLVAVLQAIDKTKLQVVAFSNHLLDDDDATKVLKMLFDEWHDIKNSDDATTVELIRSNGIDVLIDLSGHSGDGRLGVFARRPALTQVAWLGYWASTGLEEMDYIIADPVCVPQGSSEWFSEKVFRLPTTRLCMTTPELLRPIPVSQSPCRTKGYVTFGSFQRPVKITANVLRVWAKVMAMVPESRLRIQGQFLDRPVNRDQILSRMILAGLDTTRVEMFGATAPDAYLEAHGEVDILLDTFPYTGGTTTAFALWMGVPTVTLAGDTMLSLQGASMLSCVGLTDWIAHSEAEYVDIAVRCANDIESLALLRSQLREKAERSALFDSKRFATDFQTAIRTMHEERLAEVNEAGRLSA